MMKKIVGLLCVSVFTFCSDAMDDPLDYTESQKCLLKRELSKIEPDISRIKEISIMLDGSMVDGEFLDLLDELLLIPKKVRNFGDRLVNDDLDEMVVSSLYDDSIDVLVQISEIVMKVQSKQHLFSGQEKLRFEKLLSEFRKAEVIY